MHHYMPPSKTGWPSLNVVIFLPSEFFVCGLQKLEQRAKKCIELRGEYVE